MRQSDGVSAPVILIVEDDPDLLQAIGFAFETEGYPVLTFASGEALLAAPSLPAKGCLVLDQLLPGMEGLEALGALRARGVELPAVMITTAGPKLLIQAERVGVPVVEKPLMANALLDAVKRQLTRAAGLERGQSDPPPAA